MYKINLWNTIPPCFRISHFSTKLAKISQISHFKSFSLVLLDSSCLFEWKYANPIFHHICPLKSQANFKMSPNCPKFLINDVIPEVVIIFRLRNIFFWIQRSFLHYNRSNKFFRRVNTFWFKSISMCRYDPLKQSFLLRSAQVTSSPKLIWGTQFWAHRESPKISNFQKSISSSKNIFFFDAFFFVSSVWLWSII